MTDTAPVAPRVKSSVLIVDDEQPFLKMLEQALVDDFQLVTLTSTGEAEKLMALHRFDIVVCDYLMPGEMGLEFLVRCAERWPRTRRIMLTGYINPELLSRSVTIADLSACLLKPVRPTELADAIRTALDAH